MRLVSELERIKTELYGSEASEKEINYLVEKLPISFLPAWFLKLLQHYPLAGVSFSLDDSDDESELGVELKWFHIDQIVEEALNVYPGKVILSLGYIPIATCLSGSGDPYFLNMKNSYTEDPPIVRIPHDLATNNSYPESEIELVSPSLSEFFKLSTIY